ncbi:MAG: hypothetical protein FWD32_00535 [Firmicutes bacterium]|nr:hypothetical protein [Bacillota bacterium]
MKKNTVFSLIISVCAISCAILGSFLLKPFNLQASEDDMVINNTIAKTMVMGNEYNLVYSFGMLSQTGVDVRWEFWKNDQTLVFVLDREPHTYSSNNNNYTYRFDPAVLAETALEPTNVAHGEYTVKLFAYFTASGPEGKQSFYDHDITVVRPDFSATVSFNGGSWNAGGATINQNFFVGHSISLEARLNDGSTPALTDIIWQARKATDITWETLLTPDFRPVDYEEAGYMIRLMFVGFEEDATKRFIFSIFPDLNTVTGAIIAVEGGATSNYGNNVVGIVTSLTANIGNGPENMLGTSRNVADKFLHMNQQIVFAILDGSGVSKGITRTITVGDVILSGNDEKFTINNTNQLPFGSYRLVLLNSASTAISSQVNFNIVYQDPFELGLVIDGGVANTARATEDLALANIVSNDLLFHYKRTLTFTSQLNASADPEEHENIMYRYKIVSTGTHQTVQDWRDTDDSSWYGVHAGRIIIESGDVVYIIEATIKNLTRYFAFNAVYRNLDTNAFRLLYDQLASKEVDEKYEGTLDDFLELEYSFNSGVLDQAVKLAYLTGSPTSTGIDISRPLIKDRNFGGRVTIVLNKNLVYRANLDPQKTGVNEYKLVIIWEDSEGTKVSHPFTVIVRQLEENQTPPSQLDLIMEFAGYAALGVGGVIVLYIVYNQIILRKKKKDIGAEK